MPRALRPTLTTVVIGLIAAAALSADVKFTSTFKSLDAGGTSFTGKKVAALVISNDLGLRVPAEEALVRELTARGMQAVTTYRLVPREEPVKRAFRLDSGRRPVRDDERPHLSAADECLSAAESRDCRRAVVG